MFRDFWNITALVALLLGIVVGIGSWAGLSNLFGEKMFVRGVCWTIGGLVISAFDLVLRWRADNCSGYRRYFSSSCGGWAVKFPVWLFGVFAVVGGVSMMIDH
jgi:hypothetical protein